MRAANLPVYIKTNKGSWLKAVQRVKVKWSVTVIEPSATPDSIQISWSRPANTRLIALFIWLCAGLLQTGRAFKSLQLAAVPVAPVRCLATVVFCCFFSNLTKRKLICSVWISLRLLFLLPAFCPGEVRHWGSNTELPLEVNEQRRTPKWMTRHDFARADQPSFVQLKKSRAADY